MGIEKSVKRLDAQQKVTGTAKYVEDLIPVGALYTKVVHSTIANGLVTAIDTSEAEKMPGVELIITCFDVPGTEYVTAGHPLSLDPNHADTKDVEVDVPLGKVRIKKVYSLQDSGRILNPQLAKGQMQGGIAMGIGYALGEQMQYDAKTGRPLNNNLLDYKVPTCMDIPDMEIEFVQTYEESGPFGAKGLAEPPLIPQASAIRNAILHATGVGLHELPMNPQRLVHAFREAGLIES